MPKGARPKNPQGIRVRPILWTLGFSLLLFALYVLLRLWPSGFSRGLGMH